MPRDILEGWYTCWREAIVKSNDAVQKWRDRDAVLKQLTAKMPEKTRRDFIDQDWELNDAFAAYGFWQREVLRFGSMIQAENDFCVALGNRITHMDIRPRL